LDAERRVAVLANGEEMPFDLFLGVPVHRVPEVVAESGMCVDGWIPVDQGATYDGKGICYIEFGRDRVARVEVTFLAGQRPNGQFDEPSDLLLADKAEFGTSRVRRWFNRDWRSY
jgi:sulfide:quinone oxidoreductase